MKSMQYYRGVDLAKPELRDYEVFVIIESDSENGSIEDAPYFDLNREELLNVLESVYQKTDIQLPAIKQPSRSNCVRFLSDSGNQCTVFAKLNRKSFQRDMEAYHSEIQKRQDEFYNDLAHNQNMTQWPFDIIHDITFKKAYEKSNDLNEVVANYKDLVDFAIAIYLCDKEINCS